MNSVGFGNNDIFIGVRHYPDRKKHCLVIERGNEGLILGTLRNEDMVREFSDALKEVFEKKD